MHPVLQQRNSKHPVSGLSDFHKLTLTILKTEFIKGEPTVVTYRDFKKFNADQFKCDLTLNLHQLSEPSYAQFSNTVSSVLDTHAPLKKKKIRANNAPFMNKEIRKCNMKRNAAKNKYYKCRTQENWLIYKKLRNQSVKLVRSTKKNTIKT